MVIGGAMYISPVEYSADTLNVKGIGTRYVR